jgi:hypothetical protein
MWEWLRRLLGGSPPCEEARIKPISPPLPSLVMRDSGWNVPVAPVIAVEKAIMAATAPGDVLEPLRGLIRRSGDGPPQITAFQPFGLETPDSRELTEGVRTEIQIAADVRGTTIGIEYIDAGDRKSCRRITIIDLYRTADGTAYLRSHCHETDATRTFRLDRIQKIIDLDGIPYEPHAFFREQLRVTIESIERRRRPLNFDPGAAQKKAAAGGARILAVLARSDGMMHSAEAEVIVDYMEEKSARLGIYTTEEDREALTAHVKRMRPTPNMIRSFLLDLEQADIADKHLFLQSAMALIRADGKIAQDELRLLAALGERLGCDLQKLL